MTQPNEAVGGGNDTVVAVEPTIEDRFSALNTSEDDKEEVDDGAEPSDDDLSNALQAEEDDAEPVETEAASEDDDGPAIPPPVSWTAEEKEEFKSLPKALQETLTRREAEREKFVQSKAQEASRARTEVQAQAVAELATLREQQLAQINALLPPIPDEPSSFLQVEDPYSYAAAHEQRKAAIAQHEYAQQVAQAVVQHQAQLEAGLNQQQQQASQALLAEKFPEFLDTAKGPELRDKLRSTALALGYSDSQLANTDAVDVLAIKTASEWKAKADKLDALMAKQMARVREGKVPPKVSRPGVPQGKGAAENQRYTADRNAMRGGDKEAASRVFARFV
jgi:hypothetical protein